VVEDGRLVGLVTRKDVDKAMAALKKTGEIESPVHCLWQPKE
jgi:CBS domain-containing protein